MPKNDNVIRLKCDDEVLTVAPDGYLPANWTVGLNRADIDIPLCTAGAQPWSNCLLHDVIWGTVQYRQEPDDVRESA